MKIDFTQVMKNFEGVILKQPVPEDTDPKTADPATLKWVCVHALLFGPVDDRQPEDKITRYDLALRLHRGEQEFTVEEYAKMKSAVKTAHGPLVVGQALPMLDGKANGKPVKKTEKKDDDDNETLTTNLANVE